MIIWVSQTGESLPIDGDSKLMRTGHLVSELVSRDVEVHWFASRFDHRTKTFRKQTSPIQVSDKLTIHLLDGPGYNRNISIERLWHQRCLGEHFKKLTSELPRPDRLLGNYPIPELCSEMCLFAKQHGVPFVVDLRDPWPAMFYEYMPILLKPFIYPLVLYYNSKLRQILNNSTKIISMSQEIIYLAERITTKSLAEKSIFLPLGAEQSLSRNSLPTIHSFSEKAPLTCIFLSTFGKSYDGELVINMAKLLNDRGNHMVHFIMVGDGEMKTKWQNNSKDLPNISFTGWLNSSELQKVLNKGHLGLLFLKGGVAKYWLGNKFFEYLANGLPIISSIASEASSLISEKNIGFDVSKSPLDETVAILERLLHDPCLLSDLSERAEAIYLTEYKSEVIYKKYADILLA